MKKMLRILIVAVFSIFLVSGAALASPITIDFSGNIFSGTIATDGTNAWTVGAGIPMVSVTVIGTGTPADRTYNTSADGVYLTFDTGKASNFLDISSPVVHSGANYVRGSFSDYDIEVGTIIRVTGEGPDVKERSWLSSLGIDPDTQFAFFGWSATANGLSHDPGTGLTTGTAISTDIVNTSVPEPASLLLLGLGLLGLGLTRRKK